MTAAAGATGLRSWLQSRRWSWLTGRRLRALTVTACILASGVSIVGLSGTSPSPNAAARGGAASASR